MLKYSLVAHFLFLLVSLIHVILGHNSCIEFFDPLQKSEQSPETYLNSRFTLGKYRIGKPLQPSPRTALPSKPQVKSKELTPEDIVLESECNSSPKSTRTRKPTTGLINYTLELIKAFGGWLSRCLNLAGGRKVGKDNTEVLSKKPKKKEPINVLDNFPEAFSRPAIREAKPEIPKSHNENHTGNHPNQHNNSEGSTSGWLGLIWSWLQRRYNAFKNTAEKSTEIVDNPTKTPIIVDDKLPNEKAEIQQLRDFALKHEKIPEERFEVTFTITDLIFEVLRHKMDPVAAIREILRPRIGWLKFEILGAVIKQFSTKFIKDYPLDLAEIQTLLTPYSSWNELTQDKAQSTTAIQVFLHSLRGSDFLANNLAKGAQLGIHIDSQTLCQDIKKYTHKLSQTPLGQKP